MDRNRPGGRPERQSHAQYRGQARDASPAVPGVIEPAEPTEVDQYGTPARTAWPAGPLLRDPGQQALEYAAMPPPPTFMDSAYVRHAPAGPEVSSQYGLPGVQTPAAQHISEIEQTFHHHPSMMYPPVQTGEPAYATEQSYIAMGEPGLYPIGSSESALYQAYEEQLRRANTGVVQGELLTASQHVLEASELLLRNVVVLGLTYDNPATYEQRLQLFRDFNRCWLALAQKEIDLLNELVDTGQTVLPANVLDDDTIQQLGNMLIRLCDPIAKDGLVDYEMGVEEERILDTLVMCRDLIKKVEDPTQDHESAGRPDSWSSAGSRGSRNSRQ